MHSDTGIFHQLEHVLIELAIRHKRRYLLQICICVAFDQDCRFLLHQQVKTKLRIKAHENQIAQKENLIDTASLNISEHCFQCPHIAMNITKNC